jgi:hypothetical protein
MDGHQPFQVLHAGLDPIFIGSPSGRSGGIVLVGAVHCTLGTL